jgi:predicted  nucleic acid-binding Zn-ribbon protein
MPNWNGAPLPSAPQINIPNSLPANFNWESYLADPKGTFNKFKGAREVNRLNWKGYKTAAANTKRIVFSSPSKRFIQAAAKQTKALKTAGQTAVETKKNLDRVLEKVPGGNTSQKAAKAGGSLAALIAVGGVAILVGLIAKLQSQVNDALLDTGDILNSDLSKAFQRGINNSITIKSINNQIAKIKKDIADTKDRLFAESGSAIQNATKAREKANDALYEVRQGRTKVDARIDATNANFLKLNSQVAVVLKGINNNFQNEVTKTITSIQKSLQEAQQQTKTANDKVVSLSNLLSQVQTTTKDAVATANNALTVVKNIPSSLTNLPATVAKQINDIKVSAQQTVQQSEQTTRIYVERRFVEEKLAQRTYVQETIVPQIKTVAGATSGVAAEVNKVERQLDGMQRQIDDSFVNSARVSLTASKLEQVGGDVNKLKTDVNTTKNDLDKLNQKVKEQEKVNQESNRKLDQIIPTILGIPLIIGKAEQNIIKNTPTPSQIENAAATGYCKTTQPGGCSRKMMDDVVGNINNNTNNSVGNAANTILGGVNAGANAQLLAGQATILERLGAQLPGGISGTFGRLWNTLQIGRIISILTLITTFHNAAMLSNNVLQTLFGGIDNLGQAAGFKWKNHEGNEVGFGGIISDWTGEFFKGIFGETTLHNASVAWNAANRTYQSVTNTLWDIQSMFDSARNITQMIADNTGKIGNALKRGGALFENAFPNMSEHTTAATATQAKWDAIVQGAQPIENAVSAFATVTGEIVQIGDNFNQLKDQKKEFEESKKASEDAITALITGEKTAAKVNQEITSNDVIKSDD